MSERAASQGTANSPIQIFLFRTNDKHGCAVGQECCRHHKADTLRPHSELTLIPEKGQQRLTVPPPVTTATTPRRSNRFFTFTSSKIASAMVGYRGVGPANFLRVQRSGGRRFIPSSWHITDDLILAHPGFRSVPIINLARHGWKPPRGREKRQGRVSLCRPLLRGDGRCCKARSRQVGCP